MPRFRVVTKHQVSGWRFLLHRIEHALVRRDASMIDDPQRGRSTALAIGIALACVVIAGAAVLSFFKPDKKVGDAKIVAEKETGALFVRVGDRMHPALNLTSARLIIGTPDNPVAVSRDELAKFPRGPWVGIPGAPGAIADSGDRDSSWAVCDSARTGANAPVDPSTGLPAAARSAVRTTAIGGPLTVDGTAVRELALGEARLLRGGGGSWLVYRDPVQGVVRAAIDLSDSSVTLALGIDSAAPVSAASPGLLSAITEVARLQVPDVPGAGQSITLASGLTVAIGSVLTVPAGDQSVTYYLVSQTGVVRVSQVLASMLRNADSHGAVSARTVGPDVIAANLRPGTWPGVATFPSQPIRLLDPAAFAVTCYHWSRPGGAASATTSLLVGRQLPLTTGEQASAVALVTAPSSGGEIADAAYLPRTTGRFVQVTGSDPNSPLRESLFWISDSGVRYGIDIDRSANSGIDPTLSALALRTPVLAPWSVVSLFATGPTLSQRDARIQHDGMPPNAVVAGLAGAR
ncbi:type VII secretion protein EccB [Nocardia colli]|uniref:Type VII secretion protein EccB n=1 Tax=Nocardia colli TaxID=2545717 RepID=A0A5N0DZU4_9NOCA|nr:type VII secretion protein EccB [Nocardia colli]KAA8881910.1 type VII secretion protein EccB [Nocardia colli]